jgi:large-conductance mechanosensitive channel
MMAYDQTLTVLATAHIAEEKSVEPAPPSEEVLLLREIRDSLRR